MYLSKPRTATMSIVSVCYPKALQKVENRSNLMRQSEQTDCPRKSLWQQIETQINFSVADESGHWLPTPLIWMIKLESCMWWVSMSATAHSLSVLASVPKDEFFLSTVLTPINKILKSELTTKTSHKNNNAKCCFVYHSCHISKI